MRFDNFVLSDFFQVGGLVSAGALSCFVRPLAPLSLRNFRCLAHRELPHNQRKQYGPAGPDLATLGSCCGRYDARSRQVQKSKP